MRKTFVDTRNGVSYTFDGSKVTAVSFDGEEVSEVLSNSLVSRLTAQGIPSALWRRKPPTRPSRGN